MSDEQKQEALNDTATIHSFRKRISKANLITHESAEIPYYTIRGDYFESNMPTDKFEKSITVIQETQIKEQRETLTKSGVLNNLSWIEGLYWEEDGFHSEITTVNENRLRCKITQKWIAEDTWETCSCTEDYKIKLQEQKNLYFESIDYPGHGFYANTAFNYDKKCPEEFNELKSLYENDESNEYIPTCSR